MRYEPPSETESRKRRIEDFQDRSILAAICEAQIARICAVEERTALLRREAASLEKERASLEKEHAAQIREQKRQEARAARRKKQKG